MTLSWAARCWWWRCAFLCSALALHPRVPHLADARTAVATFLRRERDFRFSKQNANDRKAAVGKLVEVGGIEPPSGSTPQSGLHA